MAKRRDGTVSDSDLAAGNGLLDRRWFLKRGGLLAGALGTGAAGLLTSPDARAKTLQIPLGPSSPRAISRATVSLRGSRAPSPVARSANRTPYMPRAPVRSWRRSTLLKA